MRRLPLLLLPLALPSISLLACATPSEPSESSSPAATASEPSAPAGDPIAAAVAAPRDPRDTSRDEIRQPEQLLRFFEVAPGQRIAELGASAGYSTSLIARVVGEGGEVYAQNPAEWAQWVEGPWRERADKEGLPWMRMELRPFDDPFPADLRDLDLVFSVLIYHDTAYMNVDRAKMNAAVHAALADGGVYAVVDHHAAAGAGATVAKDLHRIERALVIEEVEAAGFELVDEADFLAYADDDHSFVAWANPQPRTDRFVLRFRKR